MANRRFRFENFMPGRDRWATYAQRLRYALHQQGHAEVPADAKAAFLSIVNGEIHDALEYQLYHSATLLRHLQICHSNLLVYFCYRWMNNLKINLRVP